MHPSQSTARLRSATDRLARAGIDAMLLTPGADLLYLSGFEHGHAGERLLALVVRADGRSSWITPRMNVPQLEPHVLPGQSVRAWGDGEGYLPALREALGDARQVAFDDIARAAFLMDLIDALPHARIHRASDIMRPLRIRKDAAELAALRAAAATVDQTIAEAMGMCVPGRSEADVDRDLRAALLRRSPQASVAFTIIASGPNGALPHHEVSTRVIQRGELMTLDFGTREASGYHSDITVACSVGKPADPEMAKVYRVVWEAQQAALDTVRPGVACEQIDRAARGVIEAAGYGEFFVHRTGHGLGLQVHEPPYMVAGNREPLEEGMVFSVEPGIYLPGRFGVRLEVIATATATGVESLNTPRPRELPVVE